MIQLPYLSASSYDLYSQCPRKFFFKKVQGLPDSRPGDNAVIGTFTHKVFERLYELSPPARSKAAVDAILKQEWELFKAEDIEYTFLDVPDEVFVSSVRTATEGLFEIEKPSEIVVVEREMEISVNFGEARLFGIIDSVISTPEGQVVRDYKWTSKEPNAKYVTPKLFQPLLYAAGLREMGHKVCRAELLYVSFAKVFSVEVTGESLDQTLDKFIKVWREIHDENNTWKFKTSPLCAWCAYATEDLCPEGTKTARWYRNKREKDGNPI